MEVLNINNEIRQYLCNRYYYNSTRKNSNDFLDDIQSLKNNNYNLYCQLLGGLYPIYYMVSHDLINDKEEFEMFKFDNDIYDNNDLFDEDLYEFEYEETFDFDSIDDLDDFTSTLEDFPQFYYDLIDKIYIFNSSDSFRIRKLMNDYKDKFSYFINFSKLFFFDVLDYTHEIDVEELMFNSIENAGLSTDPISYRYDRIEFIECFLDNLRYNDTDNYKKLLLSMLDDSYKYIKYLSFLNKNDFYDNDILYFENNAYDNINDNSINDINVNLIIDYYLEFTELDSNQKMKMDNYLSNTKVKKLGSKND